MSNLKEAYRYAIWEEGANGWFIDVNTKEQVVYGDQTLMRLKHYRDCSFHTFFEMTFSNDTSVRAMLDESLIYESFYNSQSIYNIAGKESCALLDIALSKGGPEAIAESFYNCMRHHQHPGGQHNWTLTTRAKVAWCLPSIKNCSKLIDKAVKLYIKGDETFKGHRGKTFFTSRASEYDVLKVVDRKNKDQGRCPFLC